MTIQCIHPRPGLRSNQGMEAQAGMHHCDWIGATGRAGVWMRWEVPTDANDEDVFPFHLEHGEQAWCILRSGGAIHAAGPGEQVEILCPSPCW
eukprot:12926522-Prorocentrum_lima.AAC.1